MRKHKKEKVPRRIKGNRECATNIKEKTRMRSERMSKKEKNSKGMRIFSAVMTIVMLFALLIGPTQIADASSSAQTESTASAQVAKTSSAQTSGTTLTQSLSASQARAANISPASLANMSLPTTADSMAAIWSKKVGGENVMQSEQGAPPIVHGDYVYTAYNGKIYKLDKETGTEIACGNLDGAQGFTTKPLTYIESDEYTAKDLIAVYLENGRVEVIDAGTFDKEFTTDSLDESQQVLTQITYKDGYIYFGTTTTSADEDGYYFCYDLSGNKIWSVAHKGGFYWADAYVSDTAVYFGSEEGDDGAKIFVCKTGQETESGGQDSAGSAPEASLDVSGNVRSGITSDGSAIYFTAQSGKLCKVTLNSDGSLGEQTERSIGANSTGNMTITGGIIYLGCSDATVKTFDAGTLEPIDSVSAPGYPQGGLLVVTGSGVQIYGTYNYTKGANSAAALGGIFCISADTGGNMQSYKLVYAPSDSSKRDYSLSPLAFDEETETIYYKNDSPHIFALRAGRTLYAAATTGGSITPSGEMYAAEGSSKTFAIKANSGYKIVDITDNGKSVGAKTSYALNNISAKHILSAKFMSTSCKLNTVKSASYNAISVSWAGVSGASAYQVQRSLKKNSAYKTIATTSKTSITDKGLYTGTRYYYRVRGVYKNTSGKLTAYSNWSSVKSAKPALARAKIGTKAKKRKITITWKKVAGASGYKIYRATSKNGKYKKVKTVTKGSAGSWTNKKLKKNKKYWYKVRAYRTVKGKTVYGPYSTKSYKKAK